MRVLDGETFLISLYPDGRKSIYCFLCNRCSWNPHDVENVYCGFCRKFHEILPEEGADAGGRVEVPPG